MLPEGHRHKYQVSIRSQSRIVEESKPSDERQTDVWRRKRLRSRMDDMDTKTSDPKAEF